MILMAPPDPDWNAIADMTGDPVCAIYMIAEKAADVILAAASEVRPNAASAATEPAQSQ